MRRDGADVSNHVTMLQSSQQDLAQQVTHLQANFGEVARELADTRRIQVAQQQLLKSLLDYIQKTSGGQRKSRNLLSLLTLKRETGPPRQ